MRKQYVLLKRKWRAPLGIEVTVVQADEREGPVDRRHQPPGNHPVGRNGIIISAIYLAGLTTVFMYLFLAIWPHPEAKLGSANGVKTGDSTAVKSAQQYWACDSGMVQRWSIDSTLRDPKCVTIAGGQYMLWDEQRLLFIVMLSGALGALLHALRSLSQYVGNRKLKGSWLVMYALLPFTGSLIAVVFYAVIRGGFFAPGTGVPQTSPFAFAATAFLVGLFSQVAIEKLKVVAESFFTKTAEASDSLSRQEGTPVLRRAQRVASTNGGPQDAIEIDGAGFTEETRLEVNGRERHPELRAPTRLRLFLDAAELAVLDNGGELSVQLKNGDKHSDAAVTVS